ncbi:hypothetical protein PMAYCL1PPCAC_06132 [Pristionchus mayeri]|uniref:Small ribosomal subunit protein bS16m n=1 Tax=Pristionchus mayeri TaxID=1317129 RepID=A0AAN4ZDU8_9BILA|nr:hypothetical protein PMAYCL1PPCAC_06132 [Pristionchus mayeri]
MPIENREVEGLLPADEDEEEGEGVETTGNIVHVRGTMRKLVNPKTFGRPSLGLARFGCTNRPFYQICVFPDRALGRRHEDSIIEQVGTFDPLPDSRNEKLVALNIGRIKYWIGERNVHVSVPVLELLGAGHRVSGEEQKRKLRKQCSLPSWNRAHSLRGLRL